MLLVALQCCVLHRVIYLNKLMFILYRVSSGFLLGFSVDLGQMGSFVCVYL